MDNTELFDPKDLVIGGIFHCGEKEYVCTDKGSRVIVGIEVDDRARNDPSWLRGPPYAVVEHVFDETDMPVMRLHV